MEEKNRISVEEMLSNVDKAIVAVTTTGTSYKVGSRSLTRASLSELKALRDYLSAEAASNNENGLFRDTYCAIFEGR